MKIKKPIFLLLSTLLFVFVGYKSATTSLTHDECVTFLRYVPQTFMQIISYETAFTNNHILNTLLMKAFSGIFGSSEFVLRLPNLLALILFLFYSYNLIHKYQWWMVLTFFIFMVLNPYQLDFFGLARGYGLSISFMLMSYVHLALFLDSRRSSDLVLFNLGSFLAVLSNFTLAYYHIGALMMYNVLLITGEPKRGFRNMLRYIFSQNLINTISLILMFLVLYEPIRKTFTSVPLDFGGTTGFIHDTLRSIIIRTFFGIPGWLALFVSYLLAFFLLGVGVFLLKKVAQRNFVFMYKNRHLVMANGILIFIFVQTVLVFYLFGVQFPLQRFALFILPLVALNVFYFLEYLRSKAALWSSGIYMVISMGLVLNFGTKLNMEYYRDWQYDAGTKEAIKTLIVHKKNFPAPHAPISLGVSWVFEPSLNYYREHLNLDWMEPVNRNEPTISDDYIYVIKSEHPDLVKKDSKILYEFEPGDAVLIYQGLKD